MKSLPTEIIRIIGLHCLNLKDYISLSSTNKKIRECLYSIHDLSNFMIFLHKNDVGMVLCDFMENRIQGADGIFNFCLKSNNFENAKAESLIKISAFSSEGAQALGEYKKEIIGRILEKNIHMNFLDNFFWSAIKFNEFEIIELLLSDWEARQMIKTHPGWILRILNDEKFEAFRIILKHGVEIQGNINSVIQLISSCSYDKRAQLMQMVLDVIKEQLSVTEFNLALACAWNISTYTGSEDIVELLLTLYNIPPGTDENIAARWSCRKGNVSILKLLFKNGLRIDEDEMDLLLHLSIRYGYYEVVSYLIHEKNANIHSQYEFALREASRVGNIGIVKLLVEHGADVSAMNYEAVKISKEVGNSQIYDYLKKVAIYTIQ